MNIEAARAILEAGDGRSDESNRVLRGLNLLAEVAPGFDTNTQMHAEHDQIWAGDFESTAAAMSEDQVRSMARWGWFEDAECWSHFC